MIATSWVLILIIIWVHQVEASWNMMAHAQKPDFVFRAKQTSPFKSAGGRQFSRLLAAEVCTSAVVMLDAPCSIRQFPLHFPYSASPCALTFQLESANKFRHQIDRNFRHRSSVNVWSTTVKGKLIGLFVLNIRATAEAYIACKLEQFYFEGRGRVQLNFDGTPWRTRAEVKGKLANAVGSQYPSHYLATWCIQHYYRWCAHLGCQHSTELTPPPGRFKWTRPFGQKTKSGFCACSITFQLTSIS